MYNSAPYPNSINVKESIPSHNESQNNHVQYMYIHSMINRIHVQCMHTPTCTVRSIICINKIWVISFPMLTFKFNITNKAHGLLKCTCNGVHVMVYM